MPYAIGMRGSAVNFCTRVLDDEDMPPGHDWVRLRFDDGRIVTLFARSFLERERGLELSEGIPLSA